MATVEEYAEAFAAERRRRYPEIDAFEQTLGLEPLERERLEAAARVLACPVKRNPPNWQHGRVLYAFLRSYLLGHGLEDWHGEEPLEFLDIGTAKGFSALCLRWAADDAGYPYAIVHSCDVIGPGDRVRRNTVLEAEAAGWLTLEEILEPWAAERDRIRFEGCTGVELLERMVAGGRRVRFAFVDGKHDAAVVRREGELLARVQRPGDLIVWDDCQISGVREAVEALRAQYWIRFLELEGAGAARAYGLGCKRRR